MADYKSLRKLWRSHQKETKDLSPDIRIGISASFTIDPIAPYLGISLIKNGAKAAKLKLADYSQIMQVCFDWEAYFDHDTDVILIAFHIEDMLGEKGERASFNELWNSSETVTKELCSAIRQLRHDFGGLILVTIPPIPISLPIDLTSFGSIPAASLIWGNAVQLINSELGSENNLSLVDMNSLVREQGLDHTYDDRKRLLYRQPYTESLYLSFGQKVARFIRAQRLEAKKCLVLDCDNTLWGGIIGEDGIGGIKIGQDFPGRAFREFQVICKALKESGIILAVCSKNNFQDAHRVFVEHDAMVLKEDDIAVFKINWENKSRNIEAIASELNIGTDSLVFVDDSEYELAEVRNALPEVTLIQVPTDPADFPSAFKKFIALFDRLEITDDDKKRAERVRQEVGRKAASASTLSREDFLKSLELKLTYFPPSKSELERATQLTNKTNQFNLRTVRMTFEEVKDYAENKGKLIRCIRVSDRFGDYGLVGIALVDLIGNLAILTNLLMSCRVLGRGIEGGFISTLAEELAGKGVKFIIGSYIPTPKNSLVEKLLQDNGFAEFPGTRMNPDLKSHCFFKSSNKATFWKLNPNKRMGIPEFLNVVK